MTITKYMIHSYVNEYEYALLLKVWPPFNSFYKKILINFAFVIAERLGRYQVLIFLDEFWTAQK